MIEHVISEELIKEAQSAYQQGEYIQAAGTFEAASEGYSAAGDTLAAAEARNNASVSYLRGGDASSAYRLVNGTVEIFATAGDIRRQGMAWGNLGAALDGLGRLDEAVEAYQHSGDLLKQTGEKEFRANVMQSLSALLLRSGRQLEAVAVMKAGLDGMEHLSFKQKVMKKLLGTPFKLMGR